MMKSRLKSCLFCNALLFVAFSILWVLEYHIDGLLANKIDRVIWPWIPLVGFFAISFLILKRPTLKSVPVSIASTLTFTFLLFVFIWWVLEPVFDPHW
jgi:hypothetical protein